MTHPKGNNARTSIFAWRLTGRWRLAVCLALVLVSAVPRLADLGRLSFYGDEETSAFPARSLAQGNAAQVPSGMEYRRALPLSWLNAASARAFGVEDESSYRLSSAVFGALSVPALFLLGEAMAGAAVGGVAAAALAGSEWHVAFSRVNRMYVPFLFFFIVAAFFGWRWLMEGRRRDGVLYLVVGGISLSLHQLGVSLILIPLIGLVLDDSRPAVVPSLLAVVALVLTAILYNEGFVGAPYDRWVSVGPETPDYLMAILRLFESPSLPVVWLGVTGAAGGALGAWIAWRYEKITPDEGAGIPWPSQLANYSLAILASVLAGTGQIYGFALIGALHAVVLIRSPSELWRAAAGPLVILGCLSVIVAIAGTVRLGPHEGIRAAIAFPFPYAAYMFEQSPGYAVLLAATVVGLVFKSRMSGEPGLRMATSFVLVSLAGLGMVSAWGPTRYYFFAYPFWLIAGSASLVIIIVAIARYPYQSRALPGKSVPTLAATLIVLSGVTGGHGVPQTWNAATLQHGEPTEPHIHGTNFRPDHRTPARRLANVLRDEDIVIAEDPLQVAWYGGQPDFWLRSFEDSRGFLRRTAEGEYRDIYVNSQLVTGRAMLDSLSSQADGKVWLITSGETAGNRGYFLGDNLRRWLDSVESSLVPLVRGQDDVTNLYCLNCSRGVRSGSSDAASVPGTIDGTRWSAGDAQVLDAGSRKD